MTAREIAAMVAEHHDMPVEWLLSGCHRRKFAWPRQEAMYVAWKALGHSYPDLGRAFDRHRKTVMHGVRETENRMKHNPEVAGRVSGLVIKAMETNQ